MEFYSDLLRFDIFIVQCPGGYFFTGHSANTYAKHASDSYYL